MFDLLSSPRRRMVLYYLREHGGSATITELAERIAAMENDTDVESLTRQQQKRVYVSLYQTHVPKMADSGIIDYDQDSGEVALTSQARDIDSYLTPSVANDYPWHFHYLLLAAAGVVLFLLDFVGAPLVGEIPTLVLGGLVVVAFAVSGVVQYLYWRRHRRRLPRELSEDSFR